MADGPALSPLTCDTTSAMSHGTASSSTPALQKAAAARFEPAHVKVRRCALDTKSSSSSKVTAIAKSFLARCSSSGCAMQAVSCQNLCEVHSLARLTRRFGTAVSDLAAQSPSPKAYLRSVLAVVVSEHRELHDLFKLPNCARHFPAGAQTQVLEQSFQTKMSFAELQWRKHQQQLRLLRDRRSSASEHESCAPSAGESPQLAQGFSAAQTLQASMARELPPQFRLPAMLLQQQQQQQAKQLQHLHAQEQRRSSAERPSQELLQHLMLKHGHARPDLPLNTFSRRPVGRPRKHPRPASAGDARSESSGEGCSSSSSSSAPGAFKRLRVDTAVSNQLPEQQPPQSALLMLARYRDPARAAALIGRLLERARNQPSPTLAQLQEAVRAELLRMASVTPCSRTLKPAELFAALAANPAHLALLERAEAEMLAADRDAKAASAARAQVARDPAVPRGLPAPAAASDAEEPAAAPALSREPLRRALLHEVRRHRELRCALTSPLNSALRALLRGRAGASSAQGTASSAQSSAATQASAAAAGTGVAAALVEAVAQQLEKPDAALDDELALQVLTRLRAENNRMSREVDSLREDALRAAAELQGDARIAPQQQHVLQPQKPVRKLPLPDRRAREPLRAAGDGGSAAEPSLNAFEVQRVHATTAANQEAAEAPATGGEEAVL